MTNTKNNKQKITILSLDGGGIRGIITCVILRYIEEQLQKQVNPNAKLGDYFDLIAGSSTGGLIAAILLFPNQNNTAKYAITEAFNLYAQKGAAIFNVPFWQHIINPFGLFDEKIPQQYLETQLQQFFGGLQLKQLIKPCAITSYDITNRCVKIFNTLDGVNAVDNFYVKDICRATSAAPTFFEPAQISSLYSQKFNLIDGGVYANNPALCAFAEAKKINFQSVLNNPAKPAYPNANDMVLVSISTGQVLKPYPFNYLKNAGKIKWIKPMIDMLLSANAEAVDYQLSQIFNSLGQRNRKNYYRLTPQLKEASADMDNATQPNIEALIQAGYAYIDANRKTLNDIVKKLIRNKN
jgi:uncharacterized protein